MKPTELLLARLQVYYEQLVVGLEMGTAEEFNCGVLEGKDFELLRQ